IAPPPSARSGGSSMKCHTPSTSANARCHVGGGAHSSSSGDKFGDFATYSSSASRPRSAAALNTSPFGCSRTTRTVSSKSSRFARTSVIRRLLHELPHPECERQHQVPRRRRRPLLLLGGQVRRLRDVLVERVPAAQRGRAEHQPFRLVEGDPDGAEQVKPVRVNQREPAG